MRILLKVTNSKKAMCLSTFSRSGAWLPEEGGRFAGPSALCFRTMEVHTPVYFAAAALSGLAGSCLLAVYEVRKQSAPPTSGWQIRITAFLRGALVILFVSLSRFKRPRSLPIFLPQCVATAWRDRTGAEDELQAEKALADSIIQSLPAVFCIFDKTGRILRHVQESAATSCGTT
jgi:hypothetical protein